MIAAAAFTVDEPRLVLPNRRPAKINELLDQVLAGPTSEGSYVMSIWVPIPPRLTQDEDGRVFDPNAEPPTRRMTLHLNGAISATRSAARIALETDAGLDAFIDRENEGVSANLCEALTDLAGSDHLPLDIQFAWAMDRPVPLAPGRVDFSDEIIGAIETAARELRSRIPQEQVLVRGNVVRLYRNGNLGDGEVTIAGYLVDDEPDRLKRITVSLAEPDYDRAIEAHRDLSDVMIRGMLTIRGNRSFLTEGSGFTVIPNDLSSS